MNMTIGKKMAMGFGASLLILVIIGLVSYTSSSKMIQTTVLAEHTYQVLDSIEQIEIDLLNAEVGQRGYIITGLDHYLDPYNTAIKRIDAELATIRDMTKNNANHQSRLNEVELLIQAELVELKDTINLRKDSGFDAALQEVVTNKGKNIEDNIQKILGDMVTEEQMLLEQRSEDEHVAAATTKLTILIGTLVASVVLTVVGFLITRGITTPVRDLVDISGIVAQGDLTAEVEIKTKDEIGQLAGSFKTMVGSLREVIGRVVAASIGVSASSQQLSSAAQESNASMEEISSAIDQLAKGAQSQAQRVEETSKVMEQLNASISQSAKSSEEAASASAQASQSAQNGAEAVRTAIETMDKIENSTTITSQAVTQLGKRSEQMAQIVNVITNVADQTNLLALNAAIEAARAGEAGRGFAVVAEEVRKLAENSSKSATEIDQLIKETIGETNAAVKNMEISTKEVASGKELIANAGNTLEEIQQASENVSMMLQQISASSQQMAAGAKQVTKSVEEVAAISEQASSSTQQASASAQQMLATTQETASSAQSLSEMGVDLNAMVAKFKTGDEEARAKSLSGNRPGKPMGKRLAEAKKKMDEMIHLKSSETKEKVAVGSEFTEEGGYVND
jgi:methyl-accepting chemotaxis protein